MAQASTGAARPSRVPFGRQALRSNVRLPRRPAAQHDAWATESAYRRVLRRTGFRVAERWAAERRFLHPLPAVLADVALHLESCAGKDAFVRVLGADYSVAPAFVGRRLSVAVTPTRVRISCSQHS